MAVIAIGAVVALLAVSTALGLLWRRTRGRVRTVHGDRVDAAAIGAGTRLGPDATLLQLSTRMCSACRPTSALLARIAAANPGVAHVEVLLDDRPDLADRFGVLQTPTTLLLDRDGVIRARVGGAPEPARIESAVATILEGPDVRPR